MTVQEFNGKWKSYNNIKLVGENKGFKVYFNADNQTYTVFKDGKIIIGNKYRFIDVKCYID